MSDFYVEMAAMARDLLSPTNSGGLGQGVLAIVRETASTPTDEWDIPTYTPVTEILDGAVSGVSSKLVTAPGLGPGGPVILASDYQAVCTPPKQSFKAGDIFTVDNVPFTVVRYDNIPPAGITVATRFILRG